MWSYFRSSDLQEAHDESVSALKDSLQGPVQTPWRSWDGSIIFSQSIKRNVVKTLAHPGKHLGYFEVEMSKWKDNVANSEDSVYFQIKILFKFQLQSLKYGIIAHQSFIMNANHWNEIMRNLPLYKCKHSACYRAHFTWESNCSTPETLQRNNSINLIT